MKSRYNFWISWPKKPIFWYIKANIENFRSWPLRGQGGQNVTSNMSKWKTDTIFGFLDPKNLYFDTHEANIVFRIWPFRGQGGQNVTCRRSNWKSNAIFEFLDPKTYVLIYMKKKSKISILTSRRSKRSTWPPGGQISWKHL